MDIKEILYNEIDNMGGKDEIRTQLSNDIYNSKSIINMLLNKCSILLNNENQNEDEYVLFGESLLHFLLTMAMIPAQRKIVVDNIDIDILIPNLKNLKTNDDQAMVIHFIKYKNENVLDVLRKMSSIQKNKSNLWLVSSKEINLNQYNTFIISPSLLTKDYTNNSNFPFSEILIKIDEFLKNINYSGLKIL